MPWIRALIALVIALAGLFVWLLLRRPEAAPPKPASSGRKTPAPDAKSSTERKSAPAAKPAANAEKKPAPAAPTALASVPKLPHKDDDDDDGDITIVTLAPLRELLLSGQMPQMPMSAFEDDDEDVPVQAPEAVPIIYDKDAAFDEPTRISALILVSAAGQTDLGQRRKKNEDSYLVLEDHNLFVVADGMGGHAGGEVASKIAVDTIGAAFNQTQFKGERYPNVPRRGSDLALAIQMANEAIFERAKAEPELNGMGTTVVSARFSPNKQRLYVGHVGDSRCYRLRDQELRQVTTDHTMGSLGVTGPLAERLERAVGIAPAVKVDIIIARPLPNDIYLLCSDGLSKMVSDAGMRDILVAEKDLNKAAAQLIATANAKGGRDNITVILIQVKSPAGMML
ncbi:MAG: PP2C family serine/threonine-protein phosphatase [Minicystis sp.]